MALSSKHPLAQALASAFGANVPVAGAVEEAGSGVRAEIDGEAAFLGRPALAGLEEEAKAMALALPSASMIGLMVGGRSALFAIGQSLRPDARETIQRLRSKGYAIEILSGDHEAAVAEVAAELGIERFAAGMKPADKIARLEALKQAGRKVLMIGDGLNDAPALAAAHVSLSPIDAVHIAQAAADALFIGDELAPVAAALEISRDAREAMMQNLWLAVAYNMLAVPLAIAGYVTPLIAALAMSGSSVLVTVNALKVGWKRRTS